MSVCYSYDYAFKESKKYFNGDELAAKVFLDKYALRDNEDNILESSPEQMHRRLSKEFARIEKKYKNPMSEDEIFNSFDNFKYIIPQGSPMAAIGNPYHIQSSGNCFSIDPPYDSYGGILYTDQQLVQLMKRRCGVGLNISTLRPFGLPVKNAAKTTDGISIFMDRYSNTCREVAQKGRRGAEILVLNIHHPEVKNFINIKKDKKRVTGANISLQITDEFMNAVKNNKDYELRWPVDSKIPKIKQMISAREVWNEIINASWESAEPGILFWDNVIKNSVSNCYGEVDPSFYDTSCNPCGEIVMGRDSCRLMSLNLYSFIEHPFENKSFFNYKKFSIYVQKAQRLMDDMVDLEIELIQRILKKIESDPEPENIKAIEKETWESLLDSCKKGRRTGLGITGLGDAIAALNITYGSSKSIKTTEEIYKTLCLNAYKSSCIMAEERGVFPIFDYKVEKDNRFLSQIWEEDPDLYKLYKKNGRRNIALTTTPPAGSISTLAQVSSGIENVFRVEYKRRKKINPNDENVKIDFIDQSGDSWQEFNVYHHKFQEWKKITGKTKIEDSPYYKSTAEDVNWINSVDIQSAAQKWVCHAISKTCNLPNNATKKIIEDVFFRAWKKGCKGFTVYRDGCRTGVLIDSKDKIKKSQAPKRPKILPCEVFHTSVKGEIYFVLIGIYNGDPYEIFAGKNGQISRSLKNAIIKKIKRGKYALCDISNPFNILHKDISKYITEDQEAITRIVSTSLRHGCDVSFIVHQLEKTQGDLQSFSKAISRVLKKYIKDGSRVHGEECPECNQKLTREEGCVTCKSCGFSKC